MFTATNINTNLDTSFFNDFDEMMSAFRGLFYPQGTIVEVTNENGYQAQFEWNDDGLIE